MPSRTAVLLLVAGLVSGITHAAAPTAAERFTALHEREWTWRQAQFAGADDEDSEGQAADHLPRVDEATQDARMAYWHDVLRALDEIPVAQLDTVRATDYAVYRQQIEPLHAAQRVRQWQMPFNSDTAFWTNLGFTARRSLRDADDYRNYLGQLADMPRYFDEHIVNMRAGLKRGFSVPRVTLTGRDQSIVDVVDATGDTNLFYRPFLQMPASIPATEQARLREKALAAIETSVIPAHRRLLTFFREEYLPQARTTLAAEAMPDGVDYYRTQLREYTTLDLTPAQIHAIGLEEVAKLRKQMDAAITQTGFKGDFAEFLAFLRTDPQFYATSADELLMRAAWIAKRVDARIGDVIGHLPRRRFAIEPVPAELAPFYTFGRGGPGVYLLNTYNLPARPLYSLPALTLHESAPGHALQMPLAAEREDLPAFRRHTYISAYGEGWALYAEYLGVEMGIYQTPYEQFGYLNYQMWRAARLVIDTGIHHLHWTREQALAYLRDNTAIAEHEIATEIDRYISWPGQAPSYYLGELTLLRLRADAERALGAKFDVRAFHDTVLAQGSVPLKTLEEQVQRFIVASGKAPVPSRD